MNTENRNQLIINAAAKVHEAWCQGELRAFYSRFVTEMENGASNISVALFNACNKNGKPRNVLELNSNEFAENSQLAFDTLQTYEGFLNLVGNGVINVKRFTKRNLTQEEQQYAGLANYNPETQEENILRPFNQLSADSQKENLEAAKGAAYVYEEYAKRGATFEQFASEDAKKAIGTLIHADWMIRNEKTSSNEWLFVPYNELDEWAKQQDLDVFDALIEEVKQDTQKYGVELEEGLEFIDPEAYEQYALNAKNLDKSNEKELSMEKH